MELNPQAASNSASSEEAFLRGVFAHPLGETSLAIYLHHQELIGTRWILELPFSSWTAEIHQHAREEMKHTEIMHAEAARLRNRLSHSDAHQMNRIASVIFEAMEKYLDAIFEGSLKSVIRIPSIKGDQKRLANYYLLSLLIERRVMKVYPYIAHLAQDAQLAQTAKKIILDERGHLTEIMAGVESHLLSQGLELSSVYALEDRAYREFMSRYRDALGVM